MSFDPCEIVLYASQLNSSMSVKEEIDELNPQVEMLLDEFTRGALDQMGERGSYYIVSDVNGDQLKVDETLDGHFVLSKNNGPTQRIEGVNSSPGMTKTDLSERRADKLREEFASYGDTIETAWANRFN